MTFFQSCRPSHCGAGNLFAHVAGFRDRHSSERLADLQWRADDQQMLEYTGAGAGLRLKMLVLHDDAKREYAYGPAEGLPAYGT